MNKTATRQMPSDFDPDAMSVDVARGYVQSCVKAGAMLDALRPQDTQTLALLDCLGRTLAADIVSPINVPQANNAAMDGWTFAAENEADDSSTSIALTEIGTSYAGKPFAGTVRTGECVRIFTGAVVPIGCDTVIMQERASKLDNIVTVEKNFNRGQYVRHVGEDLQLGAITLSRGHTIRPADVGLIASLGIGEATVYRTLRVAFFSTGDELAGIGSGENKGLAAGQLYDANRYTIHSMLRRMGMDAIDLGVVPDDPALIKKTLIDAASRADVIITSGGVSVGDADYVKAVLAELGEITFWKIAMKPGKPFAFGKISNTYFFGLPGNPVSAMVTFYQIVRDALLSLQGVLPLPSRPIFNAMCTSAIKKSPGRTEYQRGILFFDNAEWKVRPTGEQGSGILKSMSLANCFIVLDSEASNLAAGCMVNIELFEGII